MPRHKRAYIPDSGSEAEPVSLDVDEVEEDEYVVEAIRSRRYNVDLKREEFLIKWDGYSDDENTWEPVEHLESCISLVEEFNKKYGKVRVYGSEDGSRSSKERVEASASPDVHESKEERKRRKKEKKRLKKEKRALKEEKRRAKDAAKTATQSGNRSPASESPPLRRPPSVVPAEVRTCINWDELSATDDVEQLQCCLNEENVPSPSEQSQEFTNEIPPDDTVCQVRVDVFTKDIVDEEDFRNPKIDQSTIEKDVANIVTSAPRRRTKSPSAISSDITSTEITKSQVERRSMRSPTKRKRVKSDERKKRNALKRGKSDEGFASDDSDVIIISSEVEPVDVKPRLLPPSYGCLSSPDFNPDLIVLERTRRFCPNDGPKPSTSPQNPKPDLLKEAEGRKRKESVENVGTDLNDIFDALIKESETSNLLDRAASFAELLNSDELSLTTTASPNREPSPPKRDQLEEVSVNIESFRPPAEEHSALVILQPTCNADQVHAQFKVLETEANDPRLCEGSAKLEKVIKSFTDLLGKDCDIEEVKPNFSNGAQGPFDTAAPAPVLQNQQVQLIATTLATNTANPSTSFATSTQPQTAAHPLVYFSPLMLLKNMVNSAQAYNSAQTTASSIFPTTTVTPSVFPNPAQAHFMAQLQQQQFAQRSQAVFQPQPTLSHAQKAAFLRAQCSAHQMNTAGRIPQQVMQRQQAVQHGNHTVQAAHQQVVPQPAQCTHHLTVQQQVVQQMQQQQAAQGTQQQSVPAVLQPRVQNVQQQIMPRIHQRSGPVVHQQPVQHVQSAPTIAEQILDYQRVQQQHHAPHARMVQPQQPPVPQPAQCVPQPQPNPYQPGPQFYSFPQVPVLPQQAQQPTTSGFRQLLQQPYPLLQQDQVPSYAAHMQHVQQQHLMAQQNTSQFINVQNNNYMINNPPEPAPQPKEKKGRKNKANSQPQNNAHGMMDDSFVRAYLQQQSLQAQQQAARQQQQAAMQRQSALPFNPPAYPTALPVLAAIPAGTYEFVGQHASADQTAMFVVKHSEVGFFQIPAQNVTLDALAKLQDFLESATQ